MQSTGPDKLPPKFDSGKFEPEKLAKSSVVDKGVKGYLTRNLTRILGTVEWKTYKEFKEFVGSLADTQEKIEALKMISAKMKEAIVEAKKNAESKPLSKSVQKSTNKRIERMERMCAEIQEKIFESSAAPRSKAATPFNFEEAIKELDEMNEAEGVDEALYSEKLEELENTAEVKKGTQASKELQKFFPLLVSSKTGKINDSTEIGKAFLVYIGAGKEKFSNKDTNFINQKYREFIAHLVLKYYRQESSDFKQLLTLGEEAKELNDAKK